MTLKEKLQEEKLYINPYSFKLTKEGVENFEKIFDDYAIEFAEWCFDVVTNGKHFDTIKELLEIFKKEKGYE
jgi:flagellar motor component MotA